VHPRDFFANYLLTQVVGNMGNGSHFRAARSKQRDDFSLVNAMTKFNTAQHLCNWAGDFFAFAHALKWNEHWGSIVCTRIPLSGAMTNQNHFGAVVHHIGCRYFFWPNLSAVVARQTFGVASVHQCEVERWIKPLFRIDNKLWIHGETWCKRLTLCFGNRAQLVECWPRTFWVYVVCSNRGDATPIVDTSVEQDAEVIA
jgi:hypothetical protein